MTTSIKRLARLPIGWVTLCVMLLSISAVGQPVLVAQKDGPVTGDKVGWAVSGAGDINGDGVSDYIVGAPNADPSALSGAGSAMVYSGSNGSLIYQKDGAVAGLSMGYWVSDAGDVNADSRADFIIADRSYAYVYSGANGALLYQKNAGGPVANAGDVNGDGRSDFIVSNLSESFVYSGATGALLYQKLGGTSVAGTGDVNGDGKADFIVGDQYADPGLTNAGSAYVYSGANGALLYQKNGAVDYDLFGFSVSGAGDVNGDGRPDFMAGARLADVGGVLNCGAVYVFSGATGSLLYQKAGAADKQLGYAVSSAGDMNGDGKAEFMVSTLWNNSSAGSVYVFSGATGLVLYQIDGKAAGDNLGCSIAKVGDINGSGRSEIILGAPLTDPSLRYDAGTAYIYGDAATNVNDSCQPPNVAANFVASTTSGYAPLAVTFTDQSTGSVASWSWTFGDGGTSTTKNPSHTFTAAGYYTVTLTVYSSTCSSSKSTIISVSAPAQSTVMHVSTVNVVEEKISRKYRGKAVVTVVDANNQAVSGATVTGYFDGPNLNSKTATTGTDGRATLYSDQSKKSLSFCFTVTNVTKSGFSYDAASSVTYTCEGAGIATRFGNETYAFGDLPSELTLDQNYPNPFNPRTEISFSLPEPQKVTLEIYNVLGERVETLVDETRAAGSYTVTWEADAYASGIYFYRLSTEDYSMTKKMILLK